MKIANGIGWLAVLLLRGLVLWFLIPFAFIAWVLVHSTVQRASLRQSLCWYDRNFIIVLINGPFRPLIATDPRPRCSRMSEMSSLKPHSMSLLDLV